MKLPKLLGNYLTAQRRRLSSVPCEKEAGERDARPVAGVRVDTGDHVIDVLPQEHEAVGSRHDGQPDARLGEDTILGFLGEKGEHLRRVLVDSHSGPVIENHEMAAPMHVPLMMDVEDECA